MRNAGFTKRVFKRGELCLIAAETLCKEYVSWDIHDAPLLLKKITTETITALNRLKLLYLSIKNKNCSNNFYIDRAYTRHFNCSQCVGAWRLRMLSESLAFNVINSRYL